MDSEGFKVPSSIPQDLLLIHNIIGDLKIAETVPKQSQNVSITQDDDDSIASSDSEAADEDEVEAELMEVKGEPDGQDQRAQIPSSSDSESSSSESDSEDEDEGEKPKVDDDDGDDEDSGPTATSGTYFRTKNEIPEPDINIPDIEHVEESETLEKVGEIMSVLPNLAIVKGLPSANANRGSERALDSDTLLVFGDRKVMGYIHETFGPTNQPLYQVKFNKAYPLDPALVTISREVFHVPARSNFVFLNQIRALKGSDASNVNDEEPADYELDFSDDEAEANYKRNLKKRRSDSRADSVASSRHSTPGPSQLRDQDLEYEDKIHTGNPYAYNGPDDFDFTSGPSRPIPLPYDDPYSDAYTNPLPENLDPTAGGRDDSPKSNRSPRREMAEHRGRGRGYEPAGRRSRGRGRGHGRGRGRDHNQHGRGPYERRDRSHSYSEGHQEPTTHQIQAFSPAIPFNNTGYSSQQQAANDLWNYPFPPSQQGTFGMPTFNQGFVQPHINPRFAAAFGMNLGPTGQQPYGFIPSNLPSIPPSNSTQWQNWQPPSQENDDRHSST